MMRWHLTIRIGSQKLDQQIIICKEYLYGENKKQGYCSVNLQGFGGFIFNFYLRLVAVKYEAIPRKEREVWLFMISTTKRQCGKRCLDRGTVYKTFRNDGTNGLSRILRQKWWLRYMGNIAGSVYCHSDWRKDLRLKD